MPRCCVGCDNLGCCMRPDMMRPLKIEAENAGGPSGGAHE